MVDLTHFIKAKSVVDTYLQHSKDLNGTTKKQHFYSRLSLCQGYSYIMDDKSFKTHLFNFTINDLTKKIDQSFDEMWSESMENDEFGYKKEIKEKSNDNIKFYFGMTDIIGNTCILLRNSMKLPQGIEKKLNKQNFLRMIDIANNDTIIRDLEGTTFVNGIGGMLCLRNIKDSRRMSGIITIDKDTINECYKKIWDFYIDKLLDYKKWINKPNKRHNYIYGLTHCIINLSNFYTVSVVDDEFWKDYVNRTLAILSNIIDDQKESCYSIFNDDTLAEMLLTIKLCGGEYSVGRIPALDALSSRFDSTKLIFREHKNDSFKKELLLNEHTNILYILNVLY